MEVLASEKKKTKSDFKEITAEYAVETRKLSLKFIRDIKAQQ